MLSDKDKKSLTAHEGRMGKIHFWVIVILPVFFIVMAGLNMWAAHRIASIQGYALSNLMDVALEDIEVNKNYTYSGVFLAASQRFNTALLQVGACIVLTPLAWGVFIIRNRNRVIAEVLRKHGEL